MSIDPTNLAEAVLVQSPAPLVAWKIWRILWRTRVQTRIPPKTSLGPTPIPNPNGSVVTRSMNHGDPHGWCSSTTVLWHAQACHTWVLWKLQYFRYQLQPVKGSPVQRDRGPKENVLWCQQWIYSRKTSQRSGHLWMMSRMWRQTCTQGMLLFLLVVCAESTREGLHAGPILLHKSLTTVAGKTCPRHHTHIILQHGWSQKMRTLELSQREEYCPSSQNVISSKLWHPESRNFRIPSPLSTFLAAGLAIGIISMQAGCSRYWFACLVQTFLGSVSSVHGIL